MKPTSIRPQTLLIPYLAPLPLAHSRYGLLSLGKCVDCKSSRSVNMLTTGGRVHWHSSKSCTLTSNFVYDLFLLLFTMRDSQSTTSIWHLGMWEKPACIVRSNHQCHVQNLTITSNSSEIFYFLTACDQM